MTTDLPVRPARRAASSPGRPAMLDLALATARAGWFVFPLRPRSKSPATHHTDDCPRTGVCVRGHLGWEQRATRDPLLIRDWWSRQPANNVAIATGPSRLYVVDLDPAHGTAPPPEWAGARHGRDVLARLADRHGQPFPDTFTVCTPSGGWHLYYHAPEHVVLRNTTARAGWRIDSRGVGGYIVAPGSILRRGLYTVQSPRRPIHPLPGWLIPLFLPRPAPRSAAAPSCRVLEWGRDRRRAAYLAKVLAGVTHAAEQTAHTTLLAAACSLGRLVEGGEYDYHDVQTHLAAAAAARHIPAHEAAEAIRDGLRFGAQHSRTLDDAA